MTQDLAMANDAELLRRYADERSEAAFAEVVRRNLNLVHSAAIRQVSGNPAAAADIAQAVFTELACQAKHLDQHRALVGWLYTTTRRMAARYVRDETRRQRREWDAHVHNDLQQDPTNPEADWSRIAPVLDEAMHELVEADRNALLLRHFQQRPYAEVGAQLGLSENAARMRVERALDRLRQHLSRRGITSTASAVVIALNGPAVAAAPAGLTAKVTAGALAAGALKLSTLGLLSLMSSTPVKVGAVVAGCALLSTGLMVQQQSLKRLRVEQVSLKQQLAEQSAALGNTRELLALKDAELAASGESLDELLRLRGEVSVLRQTARQASRSTTTSPADRSPPSRPEAISGLEIPGNQSSGVFPGQTAGSPAPTVSEWAKVKIDVTGAVFVNKKRMTADEFRAECARLKKVSGAVMLFVESADQVANLAQADKIHLILDAEVPMKMALNESDLD